MVVANVPQVCDGMLNVAKVVPGLDTPPLVLNHPVQSISTFVQTVGFQRFLQIRWEGDLVGKLLVQVVKPLEV